MCEALPGTSVNSTYTENKAGLVHWCSIGCCTWPQAKEQILKSTSWWYSTRSPGYCCFLAAVWLQTGVISQVPTPLHKSHIKKTFSFLATTMSLCQMNHRLRKNLPSATWRHYDTTQQTLGLLRCVCSASFISFLFGSGTQERAMTTKLPPWAGWCLKQLGFADDLGCPRS